MSKAFVREEANDEDGNAPPQSVQGQVYLTQAGFNRLSAELKHWIDGERPKIVEVVAWAASNGDRSENGDYLYGKKRLREIDRRIGYLTRLLKAATVVDPRQQQQRDRVFFGARVKLQDVAGGEKIIRIVGPEESDPQQGAINYQTPLAQALLKKQLGDEVRVRLPDGEVDYEIMAIDYED